jgi:glycosyltransferase involved in cell wall biosynthesis
MEQRRISPQRAHLGSLARWLGAGCARLIGILEASVNKLSVSVSIATYNRSAMVREGIEAALGQTLRPMEIVIADDASTDATWGMLTELSAQQPSLRIFRHEKNTGGVENWNFAIRQTEGNFIAWCSDDDRFLPEHLAASIEFLVAHPEVGLVHSGFCDAIETDAGAEIQSRPLRFPEDRIVERATLLRYLTHFYDWPFHPSTIVMRREVWNTVGPFDARYALADTDWFVRAIEKFPAALLARHGVLNRRHPGNWSNRLGSAKMQQEIFEIVEGAIGRIYRDQPIHRLAWKWIWRNNVRARLLLTLRVRAATGHTEAACAAWSQLFDGTGLKLPSWFRRAGAASIRKWSSRRAPAFHDARQSVSPL